MIRLREFMADPEVFLSAEVQGLRSHLFRLFVIVFFATDGAGRFRADAAVLRAVLYAHTLREVSERDVQAWLVELHQRGLVKLYTDAGVGFGKVTEKYWRQRDKNRKVVHPDESPPDDGDLFTGSAPPGPKANAPELNRREKKSSRADAREGEVLYFSERLFQTAAELEGVDLTKITKPCRNRINAGLRAIREVHKDLLPVDLERAFAAYRREFPTAIFTIGALAKYWPRLMGEKAKPAAPIIPDEPQYWREFFNDEFPTSKYSRGGSDEGTRWADLPRYVRDLVWDTDSKQPSAKFAAWLRSTGRTAA